MKLTPEQIDIAVGWWKDALTNPKYDSGESNSTASRLAALLHAANVTHEKVEKFCVLLRDWLTERSAADAAPSTLHVDYYPMFEFGDIARAAQIEGKCFPWKTTMYFHDNGLVSVRCGYGASEQPVSVVQEGD